MPDTSSLWRKRGIVYDPQSHNVNILKQKDIQASQYFACTIPSGPKFVEVYIDHADHPSNGTNLDVARQSAGKIFVGRLDLSRLGLSSRFYRIAGRMDTVYVLKPTEESLPTVVV